MIKIDELREYLPVGRVEDGPGYNLEYLKTVLTEEAAKAGIPVAFYYDKVKSGSVFKKEIEDCFIMYHPEHKNDYYSLCFRVSRQGSFAYVYVNDYGNSKQMDKAARAEWAKEDRQGKSMSYKIGSAIGSGIRNMGRSSKKLEEEKRYYDAVNIVVRRAIFE